MKSTKLLTYFSGFLLSGALYAQDMEKNQVISLSVSNKGITRLSIEDDPIREMFLYPDNLQDHVTLHQSGHLFIAGENIEQEMYVSLITSKGEIQDIKIKTAPKSSSPIILKSRIQPKEITRNMIQAWLEDFGRGFIPNEFHREAVSEPDRCTDLYEAKATDSFANNTHIVTTFEINSKCTESFQVDERKFTRPGEGIYVLKNVLEPNEQTKIVMIKKKGIQG